MEEIIFNNSSSSHGHSGKTMETVEHREDGGMPEAIRLLVHEFVAESLEVEMKIHKLPASLADIGDQFVVPMALAIGPYHHEVARLKGMEKAKRMAAYILTRGSSYSYKEIYEKVRYVAEHARSLYAIEAVSGINPDVFADMMFYDGCFLLVYMKLCSAKGEVVVEEEEVAALKSQLEHFLLSNKACIDNDIMLLENQLPWLVIEALMPVAQVDVGAFIRNMRNSMWRKSWSCDVIVIGPHILSLLLLRKKVSLAQDEPLPGGVVVSAAISATELEEIGIKLGHSKTAYFGDMTVRRGIFSDELFLSPLNLDRTRASWLANMVAFQVCTALPGSGLDEATYICSYVAILSMLMRREEDVHKLRSEGFIQGELSDKQILQFFNRLSQQVTPGGRYFEILIDIEHCRSNRWLQNMVRKFLSDNAKTIATVLSVIGVLVGIFKALYSLKQH